MKKSVRGVLSLVLACLFLLAACTPGLSQEEQQAVVKEAVALQTDGGIYQGDEFTVVQLRKGDKIYGMLPGQSAFYTDAETVEKADGSYTALYQLLQMMPHPEYGYRTQVATYEVQEDMWVAKGQCLANSVIDGQVAGNGGGVQYVIANYEDTLKNVETVDLHE